MKNTLLLHGPEGQLARVDPGSPAEQLFREKGYVADGDETEIEEEGGESPVHARRGRKPKAQD